MIKYSAEVADGKGEVSMDSSNPTAEESKGETKPGSHSAAGETLATSQQLFTSPHRLEDFANPIFGSRSELQPAVLS